MTDDLLPSELMPRKKGLHGVSNVTLHSITLRYISSTYFYISDPSSSTGTTKAPAKNKAGSWIL